MKNIILEDMGKILILVGVIVVIAAILFAFGVPEKKRREDY